MLTMMTSATTAARMIPPKIPMPCFGAGGTVRLELTTHGLKVHCSTN